MRKFPVRLMRARALLALIGPAASGVAGAQAYTYAFQFGSEGSGAGQFGTLNSIVITPGTRRLLTSDGGNNTVQIFDVAGNFIDQFGSAGTGNGQLNYPAGLRAEPGSENILVTDYGNQRVEMFSRQGTFINQIGSPGTNGGQFTYPCDIAIDPVTHNRVISDGWGARVEIFGVGGNFLSQFGTQGSAPGQFTYACGLAIDPQNGHILVTDELNNNVQVFSSTGTYLGQFGSEGSGPAQLHSPGALAFDAVNRNILVTDYFNDRVQIFAPNGSYIGQWGSTGEGPGQFSGPLGVAADPLTHEIYIAERGNHRVQAFTPALSDDVCGPTVVSLSVEPLTAQLNQSLLFSARASIHSPFAGTVSFVVDGSASACVAAMRDVSAMCTNPLQLGTHTIVAHYSGDGSNQPGCSPPQSVTVVSDTAGATTTIGCSVVPDPAIQGQAARVVCDLSGAVARRAGIDGDGTGSLGYLTVAQGSDILEYLPVEFGGAGFSTVLSGGSHPLTITYSGNADNEGSTTSLPVVVLTPADDIFYGDFDIAPEN